MNKYPDAADILSLLKRLREQADFLDDIRNKVVTAPEPKSVALPSKPVVQEGASAEVQAAVAAPETPLESIDQQVTPISEYPGEEGQDDSNSGQSG